MTTPEPQKPYHHNATQRTPMPQDPTEINRNDQQGHLTVLPCRIYSHPRRPWWLYFKLNVPYEPAGKPYILTAKGHIFEDPFIQKILNKTETSRKIMMPNATGKFIETYVAMSPDGINYRTTLTVTIDRGP